MKMRRRFCSSMVLQCIIVKVLGRLSDQNISVWRIFSQIRTMRNSNQSWIEPNISVVAGLAYNSATQDIGELTKLPINFKQEFSFIRNIFFHSALLIGQWWYLKWWLVNVSNIYENWPLLDRWYCGLWWIWRSVKPETFLTYTNCVSSKCYDSQNKKGIQLTMISSDHKPCYRVMIIILLILEAVHRVRGRTDSCYINLIIFASQFIITDINFIVCLKWGINSYWNYV